MAAAFVYPDSLILDNLTKYNKDLSKALCPSDLFNLIIKRPEFSLSPVYTNYWGPIKTADTHEYTFGFLFNWFIKLAAEYDPIPKTKVFDIEYNQVNIDYLVLYTDYVLNHFTDNNVKYTCSKITSLLLHRPLINLPIKLSVPSSSSSSSSSLSLLKQQQQEEEDKKKKKKKKKHRKRKHHPSSNSSSSFSFTPSSSSSFFYCNMDEAAAEEEVEVVERKKSSLENDRDILKCANSNFADQFAIVKTPKINTCINVTNGTTDEELNCEIDKLSEALLEELKDINDEVNYKVPHPLSQNFIKNYSVKIESDVFYPMNTMYDLLITLPPHHYNITTRISHFCFKYNLNTPGEDFEDYIAKPCMAIQYCVVEITPELSGLKGVRPAIFHHRCVYDIMYEANSMTRTKFVKILSQLTNYIEYLKSKPDEKYVCALCMLVTSLREEEAGIGINLCNIIQEFQMKTYNSINSIYTVTTLEEDSLKDIRFVPQDEGKCHIVEYRGAIYQ